MVAIIAEKTRVILLFCNVTTFISSMNHKKSSFNESHDCDFIYKVEKKACINSIKRKAIVYSDGIKAVMFYSVIKKCSTSRHYSWWLNLHAILGYSPSMN